MKSSEIISNQNIMKTVLHNGKIYEIEDYQLSALNNYESKLLKLPKSKRKGSLEESMFNDCKFEVFSQKEYNTIVKAF